MPPNAVRKMRLAAAIPIRKVCVKTKLTQ